MKASSPVEQAVLAVLQAYAEAYASRDMSQLLDLHADDADVVMLGTGGDERRLGKTEIRMQAERDWSQSDSLALKFGWTSVSAAGPIAWVSAELAIHWSAEGQQHSVPARFSAVLELRSARWHIVQTHFSLPATDQTSGHSFPTPAGA